jgi:tetratricopeptide (TPR) repeat protein
MKSVCPICGTRKAKRLCKRREMAEICPLCCAGARVAECGDCSHYATAQGYRAGRATSGAMPDGHFIVEINPEVEQAVNEAAELAGRGRMDQARATMERLLREHPVNHTVHFGMGVLNAIQGEHLEAIKWFDRATTIYPYFVEAYFNKGVACQKEFDIAGSVRAFRKVVDVGDPKELEVKHAKDLLSGMADAIRKTDGIDLDTYMESQDLFNRAFALFEAGSWEEALAGFRAAAAKNDRNSPTHGNIGLCLASLGRKAEALKELDRALEIDPRYEPAKFNRVAVERMEEGRPMEGVGYQRICFSKEQVLADRRPQRARRQKSPRKLGRSASDA